MIPQSKLSLQGMNTTGYWRGIELILRVTSDYKISYKTIFDNLKQRTLYFRSIFYQISLFSVYICPTMKFGLLYLTFLSIRETGNWSVYSDSAIVLLQTRLRINWKVFCERFELGNVLFIRLSIFSNQNNLGLIMVDLGLIMVDLGLIMVDFLLIKGIILSHHWKMFLGIRIDETFTEHFIHIFA